jgi:hypothetical protein
MCSLLIVTVDYSEIFFQGLMVYNIALQKKIHCGPENQKWYVTINESAIN